MRKEGLEPPRPFGLAVLSRARLPFRHFRTDLPGKSSIGPMLFLAVRPSVKINKER